MKLLAFDTSAEQMTIAVSRDDGAAPAVWTLQDQGGAKASAGLIAGVLDLLRQAGLELRALDAICFGCGPGYFTGLRTACAVAQGLAFGAGVPVLPVNSLLAVAEDARHQVAATAGTLRVHAMLDARMDEIYSAVFDFADGAWAELRPAELLRPEAITIAAQPGGNTWAAGNVFGVYGERLSGIAADVQTILAMPRADAMLRLAPHMLAAGKAVPAEQALPTYVRDKVAQTTAEREAIKAAQAAGAQP